MDGRLGIAGGDSSCGLVSLTADLGLVLLRAWLVTRARWSRVLRQSWVHLEASQRGQEAWPASIFCLFCFVFSEAPSSLKKI